VSHGYHTFAPLHLPDEIAGIEAVTSRLSSPLQVACFDAVFHRSTPEVAQRFALPRALWYEDIRRYTHEFIFPQPQENLE
jgi:acetate kinase